MRPVRGSGGKAKLRAATATVAVLATFAAVAPAAHASSSQQSIFMDDNLLLYRGDDVADATLAQLKQLGVDRIRVTLPWRLIAPAPDSAKKPASIVYDPSRFDNHDHLLRVARQLGIDVLLNVTGPAPLWATKKVHGHAVNNTYSPSPALFAKFVELVGRRYDGQHQDEDQGGGTLPPVNTWSIWNEPNQAGHLEPQWQRTRRGRWVPAAPRIYRGLYRAAIRGLRASGHLGDNILIGETAPIGLSRKGRTRSLRPVPFLAALFCLDPATLQPLGRSASRDLGCDFRQHGRLIATAFAHHPYSVVAPPGQADPNPQDITMADRDRLTRIIDAAAAKRRVSAGLPLWYTEVGWQTNPPDTTARGIPLDHQATYIAQAQRIAWADPRVAGITQFLLRDDLPWTQYRKGSKAYWRTYQTGIEYADGSPKPSYDAYRLPFVGPDAAPAGGTVTLWGMVRPPARSAQPTVHIQFAAQGSTTFSDVGDPVTVSDAHGYFQVQVKTTQPGMWRFTWQSPATGPKQSLIDRLEGKKPAPPPLYNSNPVAIRVTR
jgi:hypothetical protein